MFSWFILVALDVALTRITEQSSTQDPYLSSLAVDGSDSTCSSTTSGSLLKWWKVDLGWIYFIRGFEIYLSGSLKKVTLRVDDIL